LFKPFHSHHHTIPHYIFEAFSTIPTPSIH
jgi:hypothetical protein